MTETEIKHVQDIFNRAKGGVTEIAYKLGVHTATVERWPRHGIPDKYWGKLFQYYGVSALDCFKINAKIRKYRA